METYSFEKFCGSELIKNDTANFVDFSICMRNTIIPWIPICYLMVVGPCILFSLLGLKNSALKLPIRFYVKTAIMILLILGNISLGAISIFRLNQPNVYAANIFTPFINALSYVFVTFVLVLESKRGLNYSVFRAGFWFISILCYTFLLRTTINELYDFHDRYIPNFIFFYIIYSLLVINFLYEFLPEKKANSFLKDKKRYPEKHVSLFSWLTFWWITKLAIKGFKKDLTRDDMWEVDEEEKSKKLSDDLEKAWQKSVNKFYTTKSRKIKKVLNVEYKIDENNQESIKTEEMTKELLNLSYKHSPSLGFVLLKMHWPQILSSTILKLTMDLATASGPIILESLIQFIGNPSHTIEWGIILVLALFLKTVFECFSNNHSLHTITITGIRIRTALINLIYKKSLRLSTSARKDSSIGEIVNIMQVNTQIFVDLANSFHMIVSAPFQIILAVFILWLYIGTSAFVAFGVMLVLIPIMSLLSVLQDKTESEKIEIKDKRIKLINDILNGIKVLKYYGWENSFNNIIKKMRLSELKILKRYSILFGLSGFSYGFASFCVQAAAFSTFIFISDANFLIPSTAFVCLTLFNMIRTPLYMLPLLISNLVQTKVALRRITNFLILDEMDENQIKREEIKGEAISFKNVDMAWTTDKEDLVLNNLTFKLEQGRLIAVVGSVGSGKSSLLSSVLGEMNKFRGRINVNGTLSYVPQQAWIQNATVKDNILFGKEFDKKFYEKVVTCCALKPDFNILAAGDLTEIGEKGINLSGGQKQRISLSRAVYSDTDIFLLDDPLSAVDAHVGKQIFDSVIGPNGILKEKSRLFVTNSVAFLPECDEIIMLEDGMIVEMGTYDKLMQKEGKFAEFMSNSFLELDEEEEKKEEEKITIKEEAKNEKIINSRKVTLEESELKRTDNNNQFITYRRSSKRNIEKVSVNGGGEEDEEFKIISKEKIESGNVKWSNFIDYFKACSWWWTGIFTLFYILSNVAIFVNHYYLTIWSDEEEFQFANATFPNRTMINPPRTERFLNQRNYNLILFIITGIFPHVLAFVADVLVGFRMVLSSSKYLHEKMLFTLMRSTMGFFESTPIGRILNRFSKDMNSVELQLPISFKEFSFGIYDVLNNSAMIVYSTPWFIAVLIPLTIVYVLIQRFYVATFSKLKRLDSVSRSPIFSHFGETLTGVSTIRAYRAQNRFVKRIEERVDNNNQFAYPTIICNLWLGIRLELIGSLIVLFASLFSLVSKGSSSFSPGLAGLAISNAISMSTMLNYLVRMTAEFESNVTAIERIREYFNIPQEAEWEIAETKPPVEWPTEGKIEFKNFYLKYREDLSHALKDINCTINAQEKIGIVGRTGAGKSSLSLGLFRILEIKEGDIIIDGINIKTIGLHNLRQKLTIIPQDPVLFTGSLRLNLDPFEQYTDNQLWNALEKANLKEFVEELDDKLEYECAEGGENLSVGQRQLICLARALLRNSKIILLDEATAAIDHSTDALIQNTIRTAFSECTILTIAHRLNTIMDCDRIMVLDKGRIIEFDSPSNLLLDENSVFFSMAVSAGLA